MGGSADSRPAGPVSEGVEIRFLPQGEEITLKPTGWLRYPIAGFFAFWLCGWAVGEAVALGLLLGPLIRPLLLERFPQIARMLPEQALPVPVLAFLALWTVFWTFGGLSAFHTALRILIGRDRFLIGFTEVRVSQWPFGRPRKLLPHNGTEIEIRRKDKALVAITGGKTVVLTQGGTEDDRLWLRSRLQTALGIRAEAAAQIPGFGDPAAVLSKEPATPTGWEADPLPGGGISLHRPRKDEAKSTGCAAIFALAWISGVAWFFVKAGPVAEPLSAAGGFAAFLLLSSAAIAFGAWWIAVARESWTARPGILTWERRLLGRISKREVFENPRISVEFSSDSDNDEWFELTVSAPPLSRRVLRRMNDASEPVNLARLLAYHSKVTPRIAREALET